VDQTFRGYFLFRKADDAGGLSPGKDNNVAKQKIDRKDETVFKWLDYIMRDGGFSYIDIVD